MSTLVIKNLPEALHANLKARARRNHRSQNNEAVALLEEVLRFEDILDDNPSTPKLSPPLKLRKEYRPTIQEIEDTIAQGRE